MHDHTRGLCYSAEARAWAARNGRGDDYVDVGLNAHALVIVRQLQLGGVGLPASLRTMEPEWRRALGRGLSAQVVRAQQRGGTWADWETLALCRLALGRDWTASGSR